MLISKIKKIAVFLFLTLFLLIVFSTPLKTNAASPTIKISTTELSLDKETNFFTWKVGIKTTDVPDNTKITLLISEKAPNIPEINLPSASINIKNNISSYTLTDLKPNEKYSISGSAFVNSTIFGGKEVFDLLSIETTTKNLAKVDSSGKSSDYRLPTATEISNSGISSPDVCVLSTSDMNNFKPLSSEKYFYLKAGNAFPNKYGGPFDNVESCKQDAERDAKEYALIDPTLTPKDTNTYYKPLAPLPNPDTGLLEEGPINTAGPCAFGKYLNILIKLFFGICAVLAMIMIVIGGIQYLTTELISSKESAKHSITGAIFGFLLALAAYMLLNTINPELLKVCLDKLPQAEVVIDKENDLPQTAINGKYCINTSGANGGYAAGTDWASIAGAKATLPAGVSTYNKECAKVGDTGCTSTFGLDTSYLSKIVNSCTNCKPLLLTGGTECWLHGKKNQDTRHHPKSSTIDLNPTDALNKYITDGKILKDWTWYKKDGMSFLKEPNHWHAQ